MPLATCSRRHAHGALRVSDRHLMGCRRLTILQASFSPNSHAGLVWLIGRAFPGNARSAIPALGALPVSRSNVPSIVPVLSLFDRTGLSIQLLKPPERFGIVLKITERILALCRFPAIRA